MAGEYQAASVDKGAAFLFAGGGRQTRQTALGQQDMVKMRFSALECCSLENHKEFRLFYFMVDREKLTQLIRLKGVFSFSRSSGPGGQNVNKVNTKVLLCLKPEELDCLSPVEIALVKFKLASRMNSAGDLFFQVQEERSQLLNREQAVEKMASLIQEALLVPKKRKRTRPGLLARQRRLDSKKRRSHTKKGRGTVHWEE